MQPWRSFRSEFVTARLRRVLTWLAPIINLPAGLSTYLHALEESDWHVAKHWSVSVPCLMCECVGWDPRWGGGIGAWVRCVCGGGGTWLKDWHLTWERGPSSKIVNYHEGWYFLNGFHLSWGRVRQRWSFNMRKMTFFQGFHLLWGRVLPYRWSFNMRDVTCLKDWHLTWGMIPSSKICIYPGGGYFLKGGHLAWGRGPTSRFLFFIWGMVLPHRSAFNIGDYWYLGNYFPWVFPSKIVIQH